MGLACELGLACTTGGVLHFGTGKVLGLPKQGITQDTRWDYTILVFHASAYHVNG